MKKLGLLFLFISAICSAQITFDFEQEGLSGWVQCRDSSWDITSGISISGKASLSHVFDNQDSGHDQISTGMDSLRPDLGATSWEFTIHHGYNPSSSNNWAFFLISDQEACEMHPAGKASGYAIGVNYHDSDDLVKLWRIDHGKGTIVIETNLNWQDSIGPNSPCRMKATRNPKGDWIIYYKFFNLDEDWIEIGSGLETKRIAPAHIGLYYEYSSKQDMKLWVDDITLDGFFLKDTIAPAVDSIIIAGSDQLFIRFSEKIDTSGLINAINFMVDHDVGHPMNVHIVSNSELLLTFDTPFPDGQECTLLIHNILDLKGNMLGTSRHYFTYFQPAANDIIINEIMTDPTPSMGLPEYEFIELYNRSGHQIVLYEWQLACNQTIMTFPDIVIDSGDYLLLTHEDAMDLFTDTLKIISLLRSKTSLKNDAGKIMLNDPDGRLIDWLNYNEDWYENEYFRSGGWSLERIDPERFCGGSINWKTSKDLNGGTPGRINSIYQPNPDILNPDVLRVELPEKNVIKILFNEPMDSAGQTGIDHYDISGYHGMITHVNLVSPEYSETILHLNKELNRDSVFYLEISPHVRDCAGNPVTGRPIKFAVPEFPDSGEIVINEILFNPSPGGVDFVELYNASSGTFDLNDIMIANRDIYNDSISSAARLDNGHRLFFPQDYLLLSENINQLMIDFPGMPADNGIELPELPAYGDNSGTIVLLNRWYQVIDEFAYNSKMHFPLLASGEGVSLERISPFSPTNDPNNWHSAAEDAGFATPGYQNSQGMNEPSHISGIHIEPEIFSPDNDGIDDYVSIHYHFDYPGSVVSAWIFDPRGRLICQLANNQLLGNNGHITWDGTDHSGRRVNTGIYLVYIKLFTLSGQVREVKKTCVLSGRNL
ncbi:MAG: lamin tail domain-containing protein [Bacteroidales bacterium]|nr:lamin tail domain-containing protein [Bacteroidales bacterium]